MRFRSLVASSALFVTTLSCSGEPTGAHATLRFVSVPADDSVTAIPSQPLIVEVPAAHGTQVVFRANTVVQLPVLNAPTLYFSRDPSAKSLRAVDTINTNGDRQALIYVRFGTASGDAVITAFVPALGDSVQARIVVRPGAPKRLVAFPHDTALYVGHHYTLRGNFVDAWGNAIPVTGLTFATDSAAVSVAGDGDVSGLAIGRARVRVTAAQRADTVWTSVVPEGRIAAVRTSDAGGDSALVLVNLDGSGYRSFPVQLFDVTRPAWHPGGGYLVASILPPPGSPNSVPRLAALDTATGAWRPLAGTPGTLGDGYAQFSRDGTWIYLANAPVSRFFSNFGSAVYRVRGDGTGTAEHVGYDAASATLFDHPSPSPDGSEVAMTVEVSSGMFTLIVPSAPPLGGVPQEFTLVSGLRTGGYPSWSPGGADLMMFGTEGMWVMPAGSTSLSARRYLARAWSLPSHVTGGFRGASWSPDAHWIVAKSSARLLLVEVQTDLVLPLPYGDRLEQPAWRPQ